MPHLSNYQQFMILFFGVFRNHIIKYMMWKSDNYHRIQLYHKQSNYIKEIPPYCTAAVPSNHMAMAWLSALYICSHSSLI